MKLIHRTRWGACLAVGALVVAAATSASAATPPPPLSGSTFEGGDGNLTVETPGNTDWANVAGLNTGIDLPSGSTDNAFGQGTKEDNSNVTVVTGSIPPNKNDLTRFYEASETTGPNNHTFLYLAWERLVNIGNANLDFEINKSATTGFTGTTTGPVTLNRTAGDLLVTYDFSGSGTPTLGINTWLTAAAGNTVSQCFSANALPCWGKHTTLNGTDSEGAVNTATVLDPLQNNASLGTGLFGEAAIDLTAANIIPPGTCEAFGSAFVKSRSSSSFTAEIKDFIAPIAVNISNCGSITIKKVTTNAPANDATSFAYTTTSLTPSTFSLKNSGSQVYSALPAGNYSVTEAAQAAPWSFVSVKCDPSTDVTTTGQQVSIALATGENVTCTYTNHYMNSPTIATTLSSNPITVGGSVHDSATLSGASSTTPTGTVTYTVYTDNACTLGAQSAGTKTLASDGTIPDSDAITFNTAGTFYWQAVYSGDSNNNTATSPCTSETLVVNKAQPTVSTAQDLIPNDSFTLGSGFGTPTGTITFSLYSPTNVNNATCTGPADYKETVTVNGNGTYSTGNGTTVTPAFHATAEGTWNWTSSYSGDGNNLPASSACGVEHFTIANK